MNGGGGAGGSIEAATTARAQRVGRQGLATLWWGDPVGTVVGPLTWGSPISSRPGWDFVPPEEGTPGRCRRPGAGRVCLVHRARSPGSSRSVLARPTTRSVRIRERAVTSPGDTLMVLMLLAVGRALACARRGGVVVTAVRGPIPGLSLQPASAETPGPWCRRPRRPGCRAPAGRARGGPSTAVAGTLRGLASQDRAGCVAVTRSGRLRWPVCGRRDPRRRHFPDRRAAVPSRGRPWPTWPRGRGQEQHAQGHPFMPGAPHEPDDHTPGPDPTTHTTTPTTSTGGTSRCSAAQDPSSRSSR